MCPRQGSNFLLLRQKKVTKEKASRIRRPSATLRARCVARDRREAQKLAALRHLRFFFRRSLRYSPPHNGGESRRPKPKPRPKTTRTRHGASLWGSGCWFPAVWILCRVAGLSSAAAGGSGRALFERSEFSPTPPDASSARYPAGALTSARLLFAYFLLAKQEKVSALPGAHPGRATPARAIPDARPLPGAHPGKATPARATPDARPLPGAHPDMQPCRASSQKEASQTC